MITFTPDITVSTIDRCSFDTPASMSFKLDTWSVTAYPIFDKNKNNNENRLEIGEFNY